MNAVSVVFIVDESGSMSGVQDSLRKNIPSLFTSLQAQAPGSKAGLIGYGSDGASGGIIRRLSTLTSSQAAFDTAAQQLVAYSGWERGYTAIIEAVNAGGNFSMSYEKNVDFCVAIFTDDQAYDDASCAICTQENAIRALLNSGPTPNEANAKGILFAVTTGAAAESSYLPIANATGGEMLSLAQFVSDEQPILSALVAKCGFAVNQRITLSPANASVTLGDVLTLTIGTNKLVGTRVEPQGDVPVTLVVESNRTTRVAVPSLNFQGQTEANGKIKVRYDPSSDRNFKGGILVFKACRTDVSPPACDTARALFRNSMTSNNSHKSPGPRRPMTGPPTNRFRCRKRRERSSSGGSKNSKGSQSSKGSKRSKGRKLSKGDMGSKRSKSTNRDRRCRRMHRKRAMRRKRSMGARSLF